jgi:predicted nucleic acid-binding protein
MKLSTVTFLFFKRPVLSWILPAVVPAVVSDPDDDPIVQTAITGQANVLCTRDQAFQHVAVQRVCAAHNIRILDDVTLMRELRHAASQ